MTPCRGAAGMRSGAIAGGSARDQLVLRNLQQTPGVRDYASRMNMVHISPWASALGLLDGAARLLRSRATLIMYGPWLKDDIPPAESNLAFDADLKRRDPDWGLRRVEDFAAAGAERGLVLEATRTMPANNLMLLLRRS